MATLLRHDGDPKDTLRAGDIYEARAKRSCYPESGLSSQGGCLADRHLEHSIVYDYPLLGYPDPEESRTPKVGHEITGLLNQKGES